MLAAAGLLATVEAVDITVERLDCPPSAYRPLAMDDIETHRVEGGCRYRTRDGVCADSGALEGAGPPPGRYRVRSPSAYALATTVERQGSEATDLERFTWAFSLEVDGPDGR